MSDSEGASQRPGATANVDGEVTDTPDGTPAHANEEAPAVRGNRRFVGIVFGALLVVCAALRLAWLPFDPPGWLSWSSGVYTDEGYYTLDARHLVLFGKVGPGNFHDSYTAPLLSAIQVIWFRAFERHLGASIYSDRLLNIVFAILTIGLFWDVLRRRGPRGISTAATVMVGLSPVYLFYNDLALQETPALFWIVLAFWLMTVAAPQSEGSDPLTPNPGGTGPRNVAAFLAGACVIAAFATKSLSIIVAPAVVVAIWFPLVSQERVRVRFLAFVAGLALAGAAYLAVMWPHHVEIARMSAYYARHQILPHAARSFWLNIRRGFIGGEKGVVPYLLATMPVSTVLAVVAFRKDRPVAVDPVPVVWLACGLAFCLFSSYAPSRYYVLFLPALCWLAAIGWCGMAQRVRQLSLVACLVVSLAWFGWSWQHLSMSLMLTVDADPDTEWTSKGLVFGEFAPEIFSVTSVPTAPLQPGLANDDHPIERLHPEFITVSSSPFWRGWWQARYPELMGRGHHWQTIRLGGHGQYVVDIYRVKAFRVPGPRHVEMKKTWSPPGSLGTYRLQ